MGNYHLYLGQLSATDEKWEKIEGKLKDVGQQDNYQVSGGGSLKVLEENDTLENGLKMTAEQLELIKNGWDNGDNLVKVLDASLDILERLRSARKVRYSLIETINQAHSDGKFEIVDKALRVWVNLDKYMKAILDGNKTIGANRLTKQVRAIPYYKNDVQVKLNSHSNFYRGVFWDQAEGVSGLSETLGDGKETLRLDNLNSARYLYLLSLELGS